MSEEMLEAQELVAEGNRVPAVTQKLEAGEESPKPRPRQAETRKLEPEAGTRTAVEVVAPAPHLGLTREETNWAAVAHGSILLTLLLGISTGGIAAILGVIVPAIIWYVFRDRSTYVAEQARQATIFQLAGILGLLALAVVGAILVAAGWAVSAVLVIVLIGLLLLPVMLIVTMLWVAAVVALPIAQVVYGCYAALEAYNGRPFRYWWIGDLIDRYQAQA
jgi:uncharacterized Tic20 family protein